MRNWTVVATAFGLVVAGCGDEVAPMALEGAPTEGALAASVGVVASVSGSGNIQRPDGSIRKFTISAVKLADGSVSGQYDLMVGPLDFLREDGFLPPLIRAHGTVTCLTVVGNSAYLGGTVDQDVNNSLFLGPGELTGVAIELIDLGIGPDAPPDRISPVFFYVPQSATTPQDYCDDPVPGPVMDISQGNITVR